MKTFIWSDENKSEYYFFVAVADSLEEARSIVMAKIKSNLIYNSKNSKEVDEDNTDYHKEWIEYINTSNPLILKENSATVSFHANE